MIWHHHSSKPYHKLTTSSNSVTCCRGHVDSVNEVCWQPFSSSLCTASSDKTVSIWDTRTGLCTQTFYGHHNSVNCVAFNCQVSITIKHNKHGALCANCHQDHVDCLAFSCVWVSIAMIFQTQAGASCMQVCFKVLLYAQQVLDASMQLS